MNKELVKNGKSADNFLENLPGIVTSDTELEFSNGDDAMSTETSSIGENQSETNFETAGFVEVTDNESEAAAVDAIYGSYTKSQLGETATLGVDAQEVVIGPDNRVRIGATNVYPWRAICALKITARNGRRFIGTGFLISARVVITAGHCVYMHNEGGWAASIEVIPGLNDASRPYGSAVSSNLRSVTGWTNSQNRNFDYGAIILPTNARLGNTTGTFGLAVRDNAFLMAASLNLSGYPGDKGGNQQWWMAQRPSAVNPTVITYLIDTYGGQSGAPVWILQNGQRYVVGIHTNGHLSGNSATRVNLSVYNQIISWRNANP